MKKTIKIIVCVILIAVLAVVLLIAALLFFLSRIPAVPDNYTQTVQTGGDLEKKYIAMGEHDVDYFESAAMMSFEKYEIFYPSDIAQMSGPVPAVIFVNGTGTKGSKYPALQKHLASWGFITVATEEEYAWNGFSAEMSVRYLKLLNEYEGDINGKANVFLGKIDQDNIGITGHSQGGIGVINAITDQKHSDIYKAAVILSCGNTEFSAAFQWSFDDTLIRTPSLILGSTGNTDAQIAPLESLQKLYNNIPDDVMKIMARRKNADHGEMLYFGDGYVTAWFMYRLKGDTDAGAAFVGDGAEILSDANWQDIEKNL